MDQSPAHRAPTGPLPGSVLMPYAPGAPGFAGNARAFQDSPTQAASLRARISQSLSSRGPASPAAPTAPVSTGPVSTGPVSTGPVSTGPEVRGLSIFESATQQPGPPQPASQPPATHQPTSRPPVAHRPTSHQPTSHQRRAAPPPMPPLHHHRAPAAAPQAGVAGSFGGIGLSWPPAPEPRADRRTGHGSHRAAPPPAEMAPLEMAPVEVSPLELSTADDQPTELFAAVAAPLAPSRPVVPSQVRPAGHVRAPQPALRPASLPDPRRVAEPGPVAAERAHAHLAAAGTDSWSPATELSLWNAPACLVGLLTAVAAAALPDAVRLLLAIVIAVVTACALVVVRVRRCGRPLGDLLLESVPFAPAAAGMAIVATALFAILPGTLNASLADTLSWSAAVFAVSVGYLMTLPVTRWLIGHGLGDGLPATHSSGRRARR